MHGQQASMSQISHRNVHVDGPHSQYTMCCFFAATAQQKTSYLLMQVQTILLKCSPQTRAYMQQQNGSQAKESSSSFKWHKRSNKKTWKDMPLSNPSGTGHPRLALDSIMVSCQTLPLPPRSSNIPRKHGTQGRLANKQRYTGQAKVEHTRLAERKVLGFPHVMGFFLQKVVACMDPKGTEMGSKQNQ